MSTMFGFKERGFAKDYFDCYANTKFLHICTKIRLVITPKDNHTSPTYGCMGFLLCHLLLGGLVFLILVVRTTTFQITLLICQVQSDMLTYKLNFFGCFLNSSTI